MSGHQNFQKLRAQINADPRRRAALEGGRRFTRAIIHLTALREARGATQQQIANAWEVSQANVSQIEHTPDVYLSTLRNYVEALGGRMEINAVFPDETICLLPVIEGADADTREDPGAAGLALTG